MNCDFIVCLFKLLSLTYKIQIQSHGNSVLRDQKIQTSKWVSVFGAGILSCSPIHTEGTQLMQSNVVVWELCSATVCPGTAMAVCHYLCKESPSLLPPGTRIRSKPARGRAELAQYPCCSWPSLNVQGWENSILVCWCWAGRAGLFLWKIYKSCYSGLHCNTIADGRKRSTVHTAAEILMLSWAQLFHL